MKLLKKENYFICLFLDIITCGLFTFYIAKKIGAYDRDAWYYNSYFWLFIFLAGLLFGVFKSFILGIASGILFWLIAFVLFYIHVGIDVSLELDVPLKGIYRYPYIWIICLAIPVFGWALLFVLCIYTHFWYIFSLKKGLGEAYIR